jgi:chorismate lyase/3-hydroxybenzoate synthase
VSLESAKAEARTGGGFSLVSVRLSDVERMDILSFQQSVADAYRVVLDRIRGEHPLRFWAFIPRIHADYGNGLDRYMAFNAGRFAAFSTWLGGRDAFSLSIPTASAVGSGSSEFALFGLASRWPASPVENPRQIPAYRYSRRFGPLPPCFARATLLRREPELQDLLLVGGTASIAGEDSCHRGELVPQTRETFHNLASVVSSACQGSATPLRESDGAVSRWLSLFRELRVYVREADHQQRILELVEAAFPGAARIEMLPAELCRPELLVEIEGITLLPATS